MKLKMPKAKKKAEKIKMWSKMLRAPLMMLLLLGTTTGNDNEYVDELSEMSELSNFPAHSNLTFSDHRLRHTHFQPGSNLTRREKEVLADIKYLNRHLNKEMVNFVMTDSLVDGEKENRLHHDGITAKETFVGADGTGLRLRQLTDGRHLVQVIYSQNGEIQDCEYITQAKSARNFLKTLRKELKLALKEESFKILHGDNFFGDDAKFFRHFGNVTFRILRNGEQLPKDVADWFNYDKLKMECLKRHQELKRIIENKKRITRQGVSRSTRSIRENFIVPGTKWCGAGQLAERYEELGLDRNEDRCCRAHDNCRINIGAFRRRFGYFNFRPFTVSHCRCDRRFRACLKIADTSVSNMVGKLFFNVVQTKCFVLKPMKICTQRSWWGKCLQRGYRKQAFLRDNLPY